jgi:hypothetical protein
MKELLEKYKEELSKNIETDNIWLRTVGTPFDFPVKASTALKIFGVKSILDIGCGFGEICDESIKLGIESYGIDPIVDDSTLNRDIIYKGTIQSSVDTILKDSSFFVDCIVCTNIIHSGSVPNLEQFLNLIIDKSRFLLISPPDGWDSLESFCEEKGYTIKYEFGKTHSGQVEHFLLRKDD